MYIKNVKLGIEFATQLNTCIQSLHGVMMIHSSSMTKLVYGIILQ